MRMLVAIVLLFSGPALSASDSPPQISRGVRVFMGDSAVLERKKETWAFYVSQLPEVLDKEDTNASLQGTLFSTTEEVISFFSNLSASKQENGLWITYGGWNPTNKAEEEKFSRLTTGAKEKGVMLFICMTAQASTSGASSVAWRCKKVSPQQDIPPVICEPTTRDFSYSQTPQWRCAWLATRP